MPLKLQGNLDIFLRIFRQNVDMPKIIYYLYLFVITCFINACANRHSLHLPYNFSGHVYEQKYNAMPMVDKPDTKGSPLMTTLYIYEPTKINQIDEGVITGPMVSKITSQLVDSVASDNKGAFQKYVKPGKYTVMIKYKNGFFIPYFSGVDWVSLIEIKSNEINNIDFKVSAATLVQ